MKNEFKVLARKYRPDNLADLKGQELLVRALSNAIKKNRVAHAFLLSGIRGIGKTTTARIIAKTINCENIQYLGEIASPCNQCKNCVAFIQEKHPDVLEIDAASKTGVNDVREIIDGTIYKPIMGQYKIYIIDEVHMLSTSAFNALLKTLEEPPHHVKFIFATTELRKIPTTIISRCQKFDLRRLNENEMLQHLEEICTKEKVEIDEVGLLEIAKLSEGSVRDALSLLDLVMNSASADAHITHDTIKALLGIVNKPELLHLFTAIILADTQSLLNQFKNLYLAGARPTHIIEEMLLIINDLTKFKLIGDKTSISSYDKSYIEFVSNYSNKLDHPRLFYLWNMMFKGLRELSHAPSQYAYAEMLLIKACFIACDIHTNQQHNEISLQKPPQSHHTDLLDTQPIIRSQEDKPVKHEMRSDKIPLDISHPDQIEKFKAFVDLFRQNHELIILHHLRCDVYLVNITDTELIFRQKRGVPHNLANQVATLAKDFTGRDWRVRIVASGGEKTLEDLETEPMHAVQNNITADALVQDVLKSFEGSKITQVSCENETIK
jgi:DNA polymerase-3 subunit gamma/tau